MTKYEHLLNEKNECEQKGRVFKNDTKLFEFYKNAVKGFEIKMENLLIADVDYN